MHLAPLGAQSLLLVVVAGSKKEKTKEIETFQDLFRGLRIEFLTAAATLSCVPVLPPSRCHTDAELWSTRLKWGNVMVGNGST